MTESMERNENISDRRALTAFTNIATYVLFYIRNRGEVVKSKNQTE